MFPVLTRAAVRSTHPDSIVSPVKTLSTLACVYNWPQPVNLHWSKEDPIQGCFESFNPDRNPVLFELD